MFAESLHSFGGFDCFELQHMFEFLLHAAAMARILSKILFSNLFFMLQLYDGNARRSFPLLVNTLPLQMIS
jgi:hypothetical protein